MRLQPFHYDSIDPTKEGDRMIKDEELILVAIELGFTYCEKGYSLADAKTETLRQLHFQRRERADNDASLSDDTSRT